MAKKEFLLIIDTETTITNKVADFGAVICDRQGNIHTQCGVLVREFFLDREKHTLFHDTSADPLWGRKNLEPRYAAYDEMLANGQRMLASVASINQWLERAKAKYNPIATAYNIAFDRDKCLKSGIDLAMFDRQFCLWHKASARWATSKAYREFVLANHAFNKPTAKGFMSFQTNAEVMARFVLEQPLLEDEPHTALEDVIYYELPIAVKLMRSESIKKLLEPVKPYSWRDMQVKDHFKAK